MSEVVEAPEHLHEEPSPSPAPPRELLTLSVGGMAWGIVALTFLLLRFAALLNAPVGGAEAIHLSGAWQASIGAEDVRFVPTLLQALAALIFEGTTSEQWPRLLALAATASVPAAVWLLRPHLGQAGALLALLLLAVDPLGLWFSASATAMGFDVALTLWLFVFLVRGWPAPWLTAIAGFLVAISGPLTLPLVAGWAAAALLRRQPFEPRRLGFATAGAVLGVVVASARFGFGFEDLAVPPFDLFARGFDQDWSTSTAWELLLLYAWPIALGGLAAGAFEAWQIMRGEAVDPSRRILVGWTAFALGWFAAASTSHQAAPLVALTLPSALLLGPAAVRATLAMLNAEWRWARYLLPLAAVATLLALAIMVDWARADAVGPAKDKLLAAAWLLIAVAAVALLAYRAPSRPTLVAAGLLVGAFVVLPGTAGVAFHSDTEPLPSPIAAEQGRTLRDTALELAADGGGVIAIHPDFADEITWPFRDSGKIVVASRVPLDAAVVIWPRAEVQPEGYTVVDGDWSFARTVSPPTDGWLPYLRWFIDRNTLDVTSERVSVYSKANP